MGDLLRPSPGLNINGVTASIYWGPIGDQGGIIEQVTDHGMEVRVEFKVKWKDRIAFVQALKGYASIDVNGKITRKDPWVLPSILFDVTPNVEPYNGVPYFWDSFICVGTEPFRPIKPQTDPDGTVTGLTGWVYYDEVIIPARFAVAAYQIGNFENVYQIGEDLSGFPYTTVKGKSSGEAFKAWYNAYEFTGSNTPVDDAVIIRPKQEFVISRYLMPMLDTLKYDELIGKVNKEPIRIGTTLYGAESLLYAGYEPEPVSDPSTGLLFYNIHHTLQANGKVRDANGNPASSWNMILNRVGKWLRVHLRTDPTRELYESIDFLPVIWPEIS